MKKKKGFGYGDEQSMTVKMDEELSLSEISTFPIQAIKERGIDEDTCKHFGVRTWYNESNGKVKGWCWPVYKDKHLTGYIVRKAEPKNKKDKWATVGECDPTCDLVGSNVATNSNKVFITEGMTDLLSCYQVLKKHSDAKYHGMINVVSIGFGTKNAVDHVANNSNFLSRYNTVVTAFDNDQATQEEKRKGIMKGRDATSAVHLFLGGDGFYTELENNDLNDYLRNGKSRDLYWLLMKPRQWQHSRVSTGCPLTLEEINEPIQQGFSVDFAPRFMNMLGSFRPYEMSVLLAPPKSGKSSVAMQIFHEAKKSGVRVCGAFMEHPLKKTLQQLIALEAGVPLAAFRKDPSIVSDEVKQKIMSEMFNEDFSLIVGEKGHISPDELVKLVEYRAQKGDQFFVIDHYSYVMSGSSSNNERKDIDKLLTDLEAVKKRYPIHILGVAHVTIDKGRGKRKDKEGNIIYPYWYEVEEHDGRGSSAYPQLNDNLFVINKQYLEDGSRGKTQIAVLLNREEDKTGKCDLLSMDHSTGRLVAVEY